MRQLRQKDIQIPKIFSAGFGHQRPRPIQFDHSEVTNQPKNTSKRLKIEVFGQILRKKFWPKFNNFRIDEYVEDFFKAEVIGGFTCDACKHTGDVTKEIRIWKFPDILLVSFKRFLWGVDSCQKIKGEVCIPDDKVDLKAYAHLLTCKKPQKQ